MALNFNPGPYLEMWRSRQEREAPPQDLNSTVTQPFLQGLQMLADSKRQQALMGLQQQKITADQDQQGIENAYRYGTPISPDMSIGEQGGQGASRLFGGGQQMQVGKGMPLVEAFNKFRAGGMKKSEARPEFMGALGQDERQIFYDNANQKEVDPEMAEADRSLKEARAAYLNRPPSQKNQNFTQENKLRGEFLNQSKDFSDTATAYQRMVNSSSNPSAAGDLSLIFNYMKMLDPGSTVREGEFANAAASGSYGARFQAAAQKILTGERLDDTMREDFMGRATDLYQGQLSRHKQRESEYQGLATKYNADPSRITPNLATPIGGFPNTPQPQGIPPVGVTQRIGRFIMTVH